MIDLKPCPFCGGKASVIDHHNDDGSVSVGCADDTCLGFSGLGWLYKTEAEAIKAWNTRYERTCRILPKPSDSDFVNDWHYLCSECGCEIPVYERNPDDYRVIIEHANYCPNCGAKVVES